MSKTKIDIRKRESYHNSLHNFKIKKKKKETKKNKTKQNKTKQNKTKQKQKKNKENLRTQFTLVSATLL